MDKVMVFDDKMKRTLGIVCFLPVVCFILCFLYYLTLVAPLASGYHQPLSLEGVINRHYDTLFVMLAVSAVITAPVFIYCLVLLARMKHLNAGQKLIWIVFLSIMAPVASALFWMFHVKGLPKYVRVHPDIA